MLVRFQCLGMIFGPLLYLLLLRLNHEKEYAPFTFILPGHVQCAFGLTFLIVFWCLFDANAPKVKDDDEDDDPLFAMYQ